MNKVTTEIIDYLPDWFKEIAEFGALMETETEQFKILSNDMQTVEDNFAIQTMENSALTQWELVFGILAKPTESEDFRRIRLLNRISTRPPFTLAFLYDRLDAIIGPGLYTIDVDYANYTLYVESIADNQSYATEIEVTIESVKPCHIVYVNRPLLAVDIFISETIERIETVWNYSLGNWRLGLQPFGYENDLGVIKLPTQESVQPLLLNDLAESVSTEITSARLNDSIIITDLNKTATENILTITYQVTPEQASEVTKVDLLNAANEILTTANVYVPISDTATFKHTFDLKEGV